MTNQFITIHENGWTININYIVEVEWKDEDAEEDCEANIKMVNGTEYDICGEDVKTLKKMMGVK